MTSYPFKLLRISHFWTPLELFIGMVTNWWPDAYRGKAKGHNRASVELELTRPELQSHLQVVTEKGKRLFPLNAISAQELFENAHDAIWVQDFEGKIIAANQATAVLTGYELDEFIGKNVAQFLTHKGLDLAREIERKLLGGERITQPYEQGGVRRDGKEVIFMLTTSLLGDGGMPRLFLHIGRDTTLERQLQDELCLYIQQITKAHENERNRIARELHDDTIQALTIVSRKLDSFVCKGDKVPKEVLGFLGDIREDVDSILLRIRRFIEDLRPSTLQYLGLLPALRELVSQLRKEFGCAAKFEVKGTEQHFIQQEELLIYRIVQEALRNIWKHSEATKVDVSVEFSDGRTCVTINDNGKGFEEMKGFDLVKTGKLGVVGMMERARLLKASLAIRPKPGRGTTIVLDIPRKNDIRPGPASPEARAVWRRFWLRLVSEAQRD